MADKEYTMKSRIAFFEYLLTGKEPIERRMSLTADQTIRLNKLRRDYAAHLKASNKEMPKPLVWERTGQLAREYQRFFQEVEQFN